MYIFKNKFKNTITFILFMFLLFGVANANSKLDEIDNLRAILAYSNVSSADYIKTKQKLAKLIQASKIDYSPQARLNDIERLISQQKYDCAIYEIKELIALGYETSRCYELYGDIYIKLQKDSSRIASCYKNSILADNDNISAKLKLAKLYLRENRSIMGIQTLRDIVLQTNEPEILKEIEYLAQNRIKPQSRFDSNNLYEMLGWIYQKQNDIPKALRVYERAIELNPSDIFLKYYLADLYLYCNKTQEALRIYNQILSENKYDSQIRISKAKILTYDGNLAAASDEYVKILKDYPNSAYAKYGIFKIYQAKLAPDKILSKIYGDDFKVNKDEVLAFAKFLNNLGDNAACEQFIEFSKTFDKKDNVISSNGQINKPSQNEIKKEIKKEQPKQATIPAKKENQKIITKKQQPTKQENIKKPNIENKIQTAKQQSENKVQKQEIKKPQAQNKEIKKEEPRQLKNNDKKQQINKSENENPAIIKERKIAIAKNPKQYYEHKKILDKYLSINPKDSYCYIAIANTYKQMGEYTNSIINYQNAQKQDPTNPDIYFNMALSYLELNQLENAKINLEKAINLDDDNQKAKNMLSFVNQKIITKYLNSAYEKYEKKDYVKAFEILDNAIKKYPNFAQLYYYRSLVYFEMERNSAAISDLLKVIELDKAYYMAYYQLGKTYEKIGDERNALVSYERFLSTEPPEKDLIEEIQKKVIDLGNKYY